MRIIYPYNEILPKKKAHDVFIFHECAALAAQNGFDVTLLVGQGSGVNLFSHYDVPENDHFRLQRLFILRKNKLLNLSWNLPFFFFCQRYIQHNRPDVVICSVRKQGAYHFQRKIPGIMYVYELHELSWYPNCPSASFIQAEREMLARADLITVTTKLLKQILKNPPYQLKNPIEIVPLAVRSKPLLPPSESDILRLTYVGQLYAGQGLPTLLQALSQMKGVHLKILGGKPEEIAHLKNLAKKLGVENCITFLGFILPGNIPSIIQDTDAFVAPFDQAGRMPYVAHTKLFEYAMWGRPIVAPDLPIVREHFSAGVLLYEPDSSNALAVSLKNLQQRSTLHQLQQEIVAYQDRFSWNVRAQAYAYFLNHTIMSKKTS
jgi:glycosyltransferase involved in cell wall biosynthesis